MLFFVSGFIAGAVVSFILYPLTENIPVIGSSRLATLSPDSQESGTRATPALLDAAYSVASAISSGDFALLSEWVHPEQGVLFTPFSTVDLSRDLTFSSAQVKTFAKEELPFLWGVYVNSGSPIELTPRDYFSQFLQTYDYAAASVIGINRIVKIGGATENVSEIYPNGQFVDFFFQQNPQSSVDWSCVKFVFDSDKGNIKLIAVIHSVYTDA